MDEPAVLPSLPIVTLNLKSACMHMVYPNQRDLITGRETGIETFIMLFLIVPRR
jgi:hypothetical protein